MQIFTSPWSRFPGVVQPSDQRCGILDTNHVSRGLTAVLVDVKVDLDEIIYMECPDGIIREADEVGRLNKSIYGLVQAAQQFFGKFKSILISVGFIQCKAEPCLFFKTVNGVMIMMAVHVDDCYVIGKIDTINQTVKDIESKGLKLKVEYNTKDYLSCEILFDKVRMVAWLEQPHQMKKIKTNYEELVKDCQYKTLGTPNFGIVHPMKDDPKVSPEDQSIYRSVVGSLWYLTKHSRPDIANTVRELSKCMDGATPSAFKEMQRLAKFVTDADDYGLKVLPTISRAKKWKMTVYADFDWAGDKDNWHSVSGYTIFLSDTVILWKSKLQIP
jgi:Reverse transcriptase (RNA-dependent DNA polymerase)